MELIEVKTGTNYIRAKAEADKVDQEIVDALISKKSFLVEAGAGAGKTYSLMKAIEWIQENKESEFKRNNQMVACITFTNAAVNVIKNRLVEHSFIIPSTIHSFAWNLIKQFQSYLIECYKNKSNDVGKENVSNIKYELGYHYIDGNTLFLSHDEVLNFFVDLLDNKKFRDLLAIKYPIILIDEYQDTNKSVVEKLLKYFVDSPVLEPVSQIGFFGDSWQTIYGDFGCGQISSNKLIKINKISNFRSAPKIVKALNYMRKEQKQISAIDSFEGEVKIILCDDYKGERNKKGYYQGDLPKEEIHERLSRLTQFIKDNYYTSNETLKVLMLTHKLLSEQQGYKGVLDILGNQAFRDCDDPVLKYTVNFIRPLYKALAARSYKDLFEILKITNYPVRKKEDKYKWEKLFNRLKLDMEKRMIDVLRDMSNSGLFSPPKDIMKLIINYDEKPQSIYNKRSKKEHTLKEYLDIPYNEFDAAAEFFLPECDFSTEHGIKGEEADNIIFVICKGWSSYDFPKFLPMIDSGVPSFIKKKDFEQNRNLFYVCCSRPKKRLFIFITQLIPEKFRTFLAKMVGSENVVTYNEFVR